MDEMEASSGATVHGVVTELSPLKVSWGNTDNKYFSGKIGAGDKAARIISFKPELQSSIEKSRPGCTPVALLNCKVKEGKYNQGLEIVASTYTKVNKAHCNFITYQIVTYYIPSRKKNKIW